MNKIPVDLIVPAYKNVDLLRECLQSLVSNLREISQWHPSIIVINDSPDDEGVCELLESFSRRPNITIISNEENLGFIRSVNKAMKLSSEANHSAVLVNADTVTYPGTLYELISAAESDPQIGFACPRSNNASLASFPGQFHHLSGLASSRENSYDFWRQVKHIFPRVTQVPTAVGFYLYISHRVLANFSQLDVEFGLGYEEENDLVMRANKVGYVAVLANHSFAFHHGSASFNLVYDDLAGKKHENFKIIAKKHPEFPRLAANYDGSPNKRIESVLPGMLRSNDSAYNVVFDIRRFGCYYNGTSISGRKMLEALCSKEGGHLSYSVYCSKEIFEFHELDKIPGLSHVEKIRHPFAAAVSLGQPFDVDDINFLEDSAPVTVVGMLDIIAHDCGYLRVENKFSTDVLWDHIACHATGIFFNSEFTAREFISRFSPVLQQRKPSSYFSDILPTSTQAWRQPVVGHQFGASHILVLGNHFSHKNSEETAVALAKAFPTTKIVCFGRHVDGVPNVEFWKAGDLSTADVDAILENASAVVLPSFYEGFGIGLIEAISFGKPVFVRDIPVIDEILATYDESGGIQKFRNHDDLIKLLSNSKWPTSFAQGGTTWSRWAEKFGGYLLELIEGHVEYSMLHRRFVNARFMNEHFILSRMMNSPRSETAAPAPQIIEVPSRTSLVNAMREMTNEAFLHHTYRAIFSRDADSSGLEYYGNLLEGGTPRNAIIARLLNSNEAKAMLGGVESKGDVVVSRSQKKVAGGFVRSLFGKTS